MNHFITIGSRHEARQFAEALSLTVKDFYPINSESDFTLRASYFESIEALERFNILIVGFEDVELFPAVLAFHSTLADLPKRVNQFLKQDNPKQQLNTLVYIEEINRQLSNQNQESEAKILINDFVNGS